MVEDVPPIVSSSSVDWVYARMNPSKVTTSWVAVQRYGEWLIATSTRVVSICASAICEAIARLRIRSYSLRSSLLAPATALFIYDGRMASCASCAPLDLVWYWRDLWYLSPYSSTIAALAVFMASALRLTESVRIYVICPLSYKDCARRIVLETEKCNLRTASCCKVEVVNGGAGLR